MELPNIIPNISNKISTNLFEVFSGVLNTAPVKISGQYKIVVDKNNNLWFDDYTERRVQINTAEDFLPQLCNFLKVKTNVVETKNLRYGAFQRHKRKYYHAPLFINNPETFPKYFIVSRVINEQINKDNLDVLQKYGDILRVVDFDKVGITKIFEEINSYKVFNYPLYFNYDEEKLDFYGWDIFNCSAGIYSLNLLNTMANQNYVDVFNNKILNTFKDQNLIFPRFLNIEFEFDYDFFHSEYMFNNFFGYYSYKNVIELSEYNEEFYHIILKEFNDRIEWRQPIYGREITLNTYTNLLATASIQEINEQPAIVRFRVNQINVNDTFKFLYPDGSIYFEYVVVKEDIIQQSLYRTLIRIFNNINKKSGRAFICRIDENSPKQNIIIIEANITDSHIEQYKIEFPKWIDILDRNNPEDENYYQFRKISLNDVWLRVSNTLMDNSHQIKINNIIYEIIDKFQYNDIQIIRLDKNPNITGLTIVDIFEDKIEELVKLPMIPLLSVNSDFRVYRQYDVNSYCEELHQRFDNQNTGNEYDKEHSEKAKESIDDFLNTDVNGPLLPYASEDENEMIESDKIIRDDANQNNGILDMNFSQCFNSFLAPHILNLERQFYGNNACNNYTQLDSDNFAKFNWFLINGECPEYLQNDIRALRYFDKTKGEKPRITSLLYRVGYDTAETIFLGIKYHLPLMYEGYSFAVYVNVNDEAFKEMKYIYEIDDINKTIYLSVNRYLDFVDLLRGGNAENVPLIDLSFFYNVKKSYNEFSDYLYGFKTGSLLLCDSEKTVTFQNKATKDWKVYSETDNKWYICLKSSNIAGDFSFLDLFPQTGDLDVYIYSDIIYQGETYQYISTTLKMVNIKEVGRDYVWIEDLKVKFWDTRYIFIDKYGVLNSEGTFEEEVLMVEKNNEIYGIKNPIDDNPDVDVPYGDYVKVVTVFNGQNTQKFKLLLPFDTISFKENYFELTKTLTIINGVENYEKTYFVFPEFLNTERIKESKLWDTFEMNAFDYTTFEATITLFHRNQIWLMIKDLMEIDLKFKIQTENQIRKLINEFLVNYLKEYSDIYQIPIEGRKETDEIRYVKMSVIPMKQNPVIWNIKNLGKSVPEVVIANRYQSPYKPYMKLLDNEFDFQLDMFKIRDSILTLYDENFGGQDIVATGLWSEVPGNIVSTLFCKNDDINITIPYTSQAINYFDLFVKNLNIDDLIIYNKNENYISEINKNIDKYILETFANYLLKNFYQFSEIVNEVGERLKFDTDDKNQYIVKLRSLSEYRTVFKKLIFKFKRI